MKSTQDPQFKGFTILESLVVLVILFVLTMVLTALFLHNQDAGQSPETVETNRETITPVTEEENPLETKEPATIPAFRLQSSKKSSE